MEYVNFQLSAFLILLLTGMVLGGFFDLYRVFRSQIHVNKINTLIGDLLFWFLAAIFIIPLIYWGTWLELRLYVWLAMVVGLLIYFNIFSCAMIPLFKKIWESLNWFPRLLKSWFWHLWMLLRKAIRLFKH